MTTVDPDGTLHLDAFELPPSAGWSEEAGKVFLKRFSGPPVSAQSIRGKLDEETWLASSKAFRAGMETLHRRLLDRIEATHPCDVRDDELAGVRVQWVTPRSGVSGANTERVLVNLHGGAFVGGAEYCGLVESLPLADVGGYQICVVDYRQGWEHRFPAASEDVAAVVHTPGGPPPGQHRDLRVLRRRLAHRPVGGVAAPPRPAPTRQAVAICSAGAGGSGDSTHLANRTMGTVPAPDDDSTIALGGHRAPAQFGYAAGVDPTSALLAPIHAPDILAQFPPTMVLTGTRSFDQSAAVLTHRALLAAGAAAELHVWEGMWHCFPYNHRMPEAEDAFRTIASFFDRHLRRGD